MEKIKLDHRPVFITEDGRELPIKAISMLDLQAAKSGLESEYRERGEPIDPPTYEVLLTGGVKVKHPLTEKNLIVANDPAETERRTQEWGRYQEACDKLNTEYGSISRDIFLDGLDIELPTDTSWLQRRKKWHIEVPEDPYEQLNYYKMMEVLRTPGNLIKLQEEVILLSSSGGVKRSEIEAAGDSFLSQLFIRTGAKNLTPRNPEEAGREEDSTGGLGTLGDNESSPRQPRVEHKTKRSRGVSSRARSGLHDSLPGDPSTNELRE